MADPEFVTDTIIPVHFLPMLGYVNVRHNQFDHAIDQTIWRLAGLNESNGAAITSCVMNPSTRLDMIAKLIPIAGLSETEQLKLETARRVAVEVNGRRNRFAHDFATGYLDTGDVVWMFKRDSALSPNAIAPTELGIAQLKSLGDETYAVSRWLRGFYDKDPTWADDAAFPWPDKLRELAQSRNPSPKKNLKARTTPPRSSPA